jgi:amino acid transporter
VHPRAEEPRSGGGPFLGAPDPDALLPTLDETQLRTLRRVGREWSRVCGAPDDWRRALPVDPDLGGDHALSEIRPGRFGRFVPVSGREGQVPAIAATGVAEALPSARGRAAYRARRMLLGPPLSATAVAAERMRKLIALPILSADALSSVAYGPEAMLTVLVLAGSPGLSYSLPISAAIALLMLAVGVSYRQTIRAYPHGGGSYIVATENLGRVSGLIAAAGLTTDYIMTVAVSVASGVAAITSAIPSLRSSTVEIGIGVIAILLAGNLRGVRQAGALFAAPTYAFIAAMFALTTVGVIDAAGRGFHPPAPTPGLGAGEGVGVLLVLRAFASGSTAMTGIEAVSDSVPAFKSVEWRNARTTLTWMIALLIVMFAGTVVLVHLDRIMPNGNETVLSQLARRTYGSGMMYAYTQATTAAILLLAANTAYNDFPRVLFLLARSSHAPRLFLRIGDRLAFSNGIILLSVIATTIFAAFDGKTDSLIPLFAVGVFLAFSVSQAGMVAHWWGHRSDPHWRRSLVFNGTGALLSTIVFLTAGVTKFTAGAWVAVLTVGVFVTVAQRIHRHYELVAEATALHAHAIAVPKHRVAPMQAERPEPLRAQPARPEGEAEFEENPEEIHHLTVVPVAGLDLATMRALAYAASLQQPVLALHISPTDDEAQRFRNYWRVWGDHLPVEVVSSPHRALVAPIVHYVLSLHRQRRDLTLTVVLPEIVVRHWWHRPLHNHTAARLRRALRTVPKIVVTTVPFHLPAAPAKPVREPAETR